MTRCSTYATAIRSPAMKTNGATAATASFTFVVALLCETPVPPVDPELPAKRPETTVPIQPPPSVSDFHGWFLTAASTHAGPYTALTAMIIQAVAYIPSHAPRRLHHSRTSSVDSRPIIPIRTTMVTTKERATSGGPQTNALAAPFTESFAHPCISSITAHRTACNTGTATNGAPKAARSGLQSWRVRTAQKARSQIETKTTDNGNG